MGDVQGGGLQHLDGQEVSKPAVSPSGDCSSALCEPGRSGAKCFDTSKKSYALSLCLSLLKQINV